MARLCSFSRLVIVMILSVVMILFQINPEPKFMTVVNEEDDMVQILRNESDNTDEVVYAIPEQKERLFITIVKQINTPTSSSGPRYTFMNLTTLNRKGDLQNVSTADLYRQPEKVNSWTFPVLFHNQTLCRTSGRETIFMLVFVMTACGHLNERNIIRETWGNELKQYNNMRITFVLGRPVDEAQLEDMKKESDIHHDILLFDFIDHYENLTIKTMMSMKWATEYCLNAMSVLKIDDDMIVNTHKLLIRLKYHSLNHLIVGEDIGRRRVLRRGKWRMPMDQYPFDHFQIKYVQGRYYFIRMKALPKLVEVSEYVPLVRLEDFYLTGLVRTVAGDINITHDGRWYSTILAQTNATYKRVVEGHYIAIHQAWMSKRIELHRDIRDHRNRMYKFKITQLDI